MKWFAVHTQAQKEMVAALNLANQGFECYAPKYRKQCRHARRVYSKTMPLFPRYLFVRMDPEQQRWRAINGTVGVSYLLTDSAAPLALGDQIIEAIKAREEAGLVKIRTPDFRPGQKLAVTDGPLANLEGLFECIDDQDRVVVLLELMGRTVRTCLSGHAVTAA